MSVVALAAFGCARDLDKMEPPPAQHAPTEPSPAASAQASTPAASGQAVSPGADQDPRRVIRSAMVILEVDDVDGARPECVRVAERHGGYLVSAERAVDSEGSAQRSSFTVRVAASEFQAALAELGGLARRVRSEQITSQDVTEEFVDNEARLSAHRAVEAQMTALLPKADRIEDTLKIQEHLGQVRQEIERIEGRQRYLQRQSDYSTIEVELVTPSPVVDQQSFAFGETIEDAARNGVTVFTGTITVLIHLLGVVLPLSPFVAGLLFIGRWLRRRFRGEHSEPAIAQS